MWKAHKAYQNMLMLQLSQALLVFITIASLAPTSPPANMGGQAKYDLNIHFPLHLVLHLHSFKLCTRFATWWTGILRDI